MSNRKHSRRIAKLYEWGVPNTVRNQLWSIAMRYGDNPACPIDKLEVICKTDEELEEAKKMAESMGIDIHYV